MKYLSQLRFFAQACGIITALALVTSCGSTLTPKKAAKRLAQSPITSIFSHNSVHLPRNRDCYEVGPLSQRARSALITWLRDSTVKEMSYVYPQYYLTTTNVRGGSEVVWAILSDGRGNMVGVLAPSNKRVPAWDLPSIGSYKVFVCETDEREALGAAIMEDLADPARQIGTEVGYDQDRINSLKRRGVTDKRYLISKPLNESEQMQLEQERKAKAKAEEEAKKKAEDEKALFDEKPVKMETSDDSESPDEESSSDDSSDSESSDSSDNSGDDSDSSSDDESEDSSGDSGDSGSDES